MGHGKFIPMWIAAVILLLRGGDCVPLLLADQQTKDCCTRGKCSPSQKADPCCEKSSAPSVPYLQASDKVSLPALVDAGVIGNVDIAITASLPGISWIALVEISPHPPPGDHAHVSLPLLI